MIAESRGYGCDYSVAYTNLPGERHNVTALSLVNLTTVMERSSGSPEIAIALIDGPVHIESHELWSLHVRRLSGKAPAECTRISSTACRHGTLVAGILAARRGTEAPAICPGCTLLVRAAFAEERRFTDERPGASPTELAQAILDVVDAGARIVNLSLSVNHAL